MKRLYVCRYAGGLWYVLKHIYPLIPEHKVFVDVFAGLGLVLLNKKRSKLEVLNDIDDNIYNLFVVLRENFDEFARQFSWLIYSRKQHQEFKKQYKKDRLTSLPPVKRAIAYFYLLNTAISSLDSGFRIAKDRYTRTLSVFDDKVVSERLEKVRRRLKNVLIEKLDFRDCIKKYDSHDTFFFCDPPYMVDKKVYEFDMSEEDHRDLADLLRNIKGKFMLIHVENEKFYEVYGDFPILKKVEKMVSANIVKGGARQRQVYVIIGNYEPPLRRLDSWLS